ncbi:MAG: 2TM domain-containing protein [Maribacter sp.]
MENSYDYKYEKAKEHIAKVKSFYSNLAAYLIIIPLLAWLNYNTTHFPWVLFPAVGWGLGLFGHWVSVFGSALIFGKNWEERKIREFMNDTEF